MRKKRLRIRLRKPLNRASAKLQEPKKNKARPTQMMASTVQIKEEVRRAKEAFVGVATKAVNAEPAEESVAGSVLMGVKNSRTLQEELLSETKRLQYFPTLL
jgi:hypothetical protein